MQREQTRLYLYLDAQIRRLSVSVRGPQVRSTCATTFGIHTHTHWAYEISAPCTGFFFLFVVNFFF
jgi:hypothetical protein